MAAGFIFPPEERLDAVIYTGSAVQILFGLGFIIYNYIKGKCFFKKEYWKYALSFNIPLIPHYLSGIILGQADRVMIKSLISSAAAGIYSFIYNISLVMSIITHSVNNAFIPYTYEKIKKRDYKQLSSIVNFLLIMVGGLVLMFSAVAPEVVRLFATEEYYEAISLVPVIALSSYFNFSYFLFGNIEFYFEENKFITIASVVGAAANVLLNYLFLPIFGYYAAGYTTLFCYILFSAAHYIFMRVVCHKNINGDKVYNGKAILAISVFVIAVSFGLSALYDYIFVRYGLLLIAAVICVIKRNTIINNLKMIKEKKS
ncbi:MAG: lipopolysaccharide biosynthesis protein [Oscillospiraceae bacterium]